MEYLKVPSPDEQKELRKLAEAARPLAIFLHERGYAMAIVTDDYVKVVTTQTSVMIDREIKEG